MLYFSVVMLSDLVTCYFFPYPLGLNCIIPPVSVKWPWRIWVKQTWYITTRIHQSPNTGSLCVYAQPMRDDVIMWHCLLLAGHIHKIIPAHIVQNWKLLRNSTAWFCCWNKSKFEQNKRRCLALTCYYMGNMYYIHGEMFMKYVLLIHMATKLLTKQ